MSAVQPTPIKTERSAARLEMVIEAPPAELMSSRVGRWVYMTLGVVFLAIGIAGYIVPLLPGTVFLLLATYFFFRSSERMYNWLVSNRWFGVIIRAYRAGYGIPRRIKIYAVGLVFVSIGFSMLMATDGTLVRVILLAIAVSVSWFILSRPTTETVLAAQTS